MKNPLSERNIQLKSIKVIKADNYKPYIFHKGWYSGWTVHFKDTSIVNLQTIYK